MINDDAISRSTICTSRYLDHKNNEQNSKDSCSNIRYFIHIAGIATIIFVVGIVPLIFGIVNLIIYSKIKTIDLLVDQQRYIDAKNKTLVWMIIGFIFAGIIVGIILLISYLKYDDVIRAVQQNYAQQNNQFMPPQQPPSS